MPYIDRDGVRIHYEVSGDGPAVLLSHGYGASARMWAGQVEALTPSWKVITWDMRGHGGSDSPEDPSCYSADLTVADMAAILDACEVEQAVIGGLSLGGYMSLAFQLAHPGRTRALMLFDTGPGYRNDEARAEWNAHAEQRAQQLEAHGLEALADGAETASAGHTCARGLALAARGMLAQRDAAVIENLVNIQVPTLVLVGEHDEPFLGATDYMVRKIPYATRVVIRDAGHAANLDQPEAFNASIRAFLLGL